MEHAGNLKTLEALDNDISDLMPLSDLTNLERLEIGLNEISDLVPLSGLIGLELLRLDNNHISDLAPLSDLTKLTWLDLDSNLITLIPYFEAMMAINRCRGDAIVVSTASALGEWSTVSRRRDLDVDLSDCADKASSVGLGIALAQPDRRVLVLDCDSVLRINLASLVTVVGARPRNLVHLVLEDASHSAINGPPVPGLDGVNFSAIAESLGYPSTHRFDNLEELVIGLPEVLQESGPTLVSLKVAHPTNIPGYPNRTTGESLKAVKEALELEGASR